MCNRHKYRGKGRRFKRIDARRRRCIYCVVPPKDGGTTQTEAVKSVGLVVMKFGGTSVADRERVFNAARIIMRERERGSEVAAVVSAQGDTTDLLTARAHEITLEPAGRELDALLTTGEQASAALLAMALDKLGCPAVSLSWAQTGITTEHMHGKARIERIDASCIKRELAAGRVAVVAGFQGVDSEGEINTLGRGGSDTSAVALAAVLGASECLIYTDVEGVYSADPRRVAAAKKLPALRFDEMLEMATLGAQVLLGRAVELAERYDVRLKVLSGFTDSQGTEVNSVGLEGMLVKGVVRDDASALISVCGAPAGEAAGEIFSRLGGERICCEGIVQSAERDGRRDISFSVKKEWADRAVALVRDLAKTYNIHSVSCDREISRVSLVGAGLSGYPDVPGRLLSTLAGAGIAVRHVSSSDTRLTVIVSGKDAARAVSAAHKEFLE